MAPVMVAQWKVGVGGLHSCSSCGLRSIPMAVVDCFRIQLTGPGQQPGVGVVLGSAGDSHFGYFGRILPPDYCSIPTNLHRYWPHPFCVYCSVENCQTGRVLTVSICILLSKSQDDSVHL